MRHLLLLLATITLVACGGDEKKQERQDANIVYICTGRYSECYHCDENCRGLCNCRASIEEITLEEAEEMGRRPCGYCY
jgi:hypothetical protein